MSDYRLTDDINVVIRVPDGAAICAGNWLWSEYQEWIAAGNTPDAALGEVITKESLKALATSLRWQHETGGVEVGGVRVATALDDQNRISTVLMAGQLGDLEEVDFKASSGWVRLTLAQIQGIAAAISTHVQACFTAERAHHEAIDALEDGEIAAYDVTTGWPA